VLDSWDGMTKATLAIFVALFVQICVPYRGLIMYAFTHGGNTSWLWAVLLRGIKWPCFL